MTDLPWLLLEKIHGHVAVLAVALCWHPVAALRRVRRPSKWTVLTGTLASVMTTLTIALGWLIYPPYRHELKRDLYLASRFWGNVFEVKEHWAHYACCFAIAGAVALWASRAQAHEGLRRVAWWCYLLAGALGIGVAVLGIAVASINGFSDAVP